VAPAAKTFFNQLIAAFRWKDSRNDPSKSITSARDPWIGLHGLAGGGEWLGDLTFIWRQQGDKSRDTTMHAPLIPGR